MMSFHYFWPPFFPDEQRSFRCFSPFYVSLYVICHFSQATCKIFSVFLAFSNLIVMYLGMIFFIFILFGVFWTLNTCKFMYFTKFGKFGTIISPNTVTFHHSLFFFWISIKYILHLLILYITHWGSVLFCFGFILFLSDLQIGFLLIYSDSFFCHLQSSVKSS